MSRCTFHLCTSITVLSLEDRMRFLIIASAVVAGAAGITAMWYGLNEQQARERIITDELRCVPTNLIANPPKRLSTTRWNTDDVRLSRLKVFIQHQVSTNYTTDQILLSTLRHKFYPDLSNKEFIVIEQSDGERVVVDLGSEPDVLRTESVYCNGRMVDRQLRRACLEQFSYSLLYLSMVGIWVATMM